MAGQGRSRWESVHGVLLLDKPRGLTSQQALQQARRVLRAAKAGHTGTLDPLADGLLPLCFGAATKFAQVHLDADKTYVADLHLGVATTTCDAEGEVLERKDVVVPEAQELRRVLDGFVGEIAQVPPIYSALKRDGKPLYAYAREGEAVDVQARPVRIDAIEVLSIQDDHLRLRVSCGKGTYIRALARDIGEALGCGAHLAALRRTRSGGFDVAQAHRLDAVQALDATQARRLLLPPDALIADWPLVRLDVSQTAAMLHGRAITPNPGQCPGPDMSVLRAYGELDGNKDIFLGVVRFDGRELSAQRLLSEEELQAQSTSS